MKPVNAGRHFATAEQDLVVFVIGMRINKPWKIRQWFPVARSMGPMQREVLENGDLGCLHIENWFGRTTVSLQYWKDFESLEAYAKAADHLHLPAWRAFNKAVRDNGNVGIWHETYTIRAGGAEAVYANMPSFGLGAATGTPKPDASMQSAAQRLGRSDIADHPVEPY